VQFGRNATVILIFTIYEFIYNVTPLDVDIMEMPDCKIKHQCEKNYKKNQHPPEKPFRLPERDGGKFKLKIKISRNKKQYQKVYPPERCFSHKLVFQNIR
jgi:hypothetical protein